MRTLLQRLRAWRWRGFHPLLARLGHVLNIGLGLLLSLLFAALAFVLFTPAGAELALREARALTQGMIEAEGVQGRLWGPLSVSRLTLRFEAVDLVLADVYLDASLPALLRRRIDVAEVRASSLRVVIKPTPETPDEPAIAELPLQLRIAALQLGQLRIEDAAQADDKAIVIDAIRLAGSWIGREVVVREAAATTPWVGALRADGAATLDPEGLSLKPLRAEGFAKAELSGRFGYGTPSDLRLRWQRASWPLQNEDDAALALDSGQGSARWQGLLDDYRFEIRGDLVLPKLAMQIDGAGRGSLSSLDLARLKLKALDGTLDAKARIDWQGPLQIDGEARFAGLRPERYDRAWPGLINGEARAATTLRDGVADLRFQATLRDSRLRGYPLALDARGRYAGELLQFDELHARSGRVQIDGRGQVLPSLDAQARIEAPDLREAWAGLSGRVQAEIRARGALPLPQVQAQVDAANLHYETFRLASLKLRADVDPQRQLDVQLSLQELDAGTRIDQARFSIKGPVAAHRAELALEAPGLRVQLAAQGALDAAQPRWQGELVSGTISPQRLAAWTLGAPAALQLSATPTLAPMCWQAAAAQACLALQQQANGLRRAELKLRDFALDYLQPLLPGGAQLSATLQAEANASFDTRGLRDLHADLQSSAGRWQLGGLAPVALEPARLKIDDVGSGTVIDALLPISGGELALQAQLAPGPVFAQRALVGTLRARLPDLSWLAQFSHEIADASGHLDGALQLAGTLAAPSAQGRIALRDGTLRLITPGITLRELGVRIDAADRAPLQLSGEARSDKGQLRVSGSVDPWRTPLALDLRVQGEDFQAVKLSDARAWVSPDLSVQLADDRLLVRGTVAVPRAEITPKSLGESSVPVSADQVLVGKDLGAQAQRNLRTEAEVTIALGEAVRFEGFGLKSKLAGSVRAFETPDLPTRARGEIRLIDGQYKAYGQDLSIETGRLIFDGGPVTEPALEIRATRKPTDEITVGLYVRGTLKQPDFKTFSTPPMPQEQQLGWLILGRPIRDSSSQTDKERVSSAATSLGFAGGEWLAQRIGSKIGIDEVTVGTRPGEPQEQAMFTVGKYLSPKLFIAYGVGLFQPGHTFRMQYDLGRGFKVRTETGVQSGGDLLYSFERK